MGKQCVLTMNSDALFEGLEDNNIVTTWDKGEATVAEYSINGDYYTFILWGTIVQGPYVLIRSKTGPYWNVYMQDPKNLVLRRIRV